MQQDIIKSNAELKRKQKEFLLRQKKKIFVPDESEVDEEENKVEYKPTI